MNAFSNHQPHGLPRQSKGTGGLLLYLDFDGVLHHENVLWHPKRGAYLQAPPQFALFQHAPLLQDLLAPYPEVRIVLSTTWARVYGCDAAAKRLPPSLRQRVIGGTFHSRMDKKEFLGQSRGQQISADAVRRRPQNWLALDDDTEDWPLWCIDKLIATDPIEGIAGPGIPLRIEQRLREMAHGLAPPGETP
jgi:hypothetical protein